MRRAQQLVASGLLLSSFAVAFGAPRLARAGDKDADALVVVAESLSELGSIAKANAAKTKITDMIKACAGAACESGTRAQLYLALGIVEGQGLKNGKAATAAFESALREDPKAAPDRQFMNAALNKLWADAQKNVKKGGGSGGKGPSKAQLDVLAAAQAQLNQKDWSSCMGTVIAGMAEAEFSAGKLLLAQCEDAGGLMLEAAGDAKIADKLADDEGNADNKRKANDLLSRLATETPVIIVILPKTVDDMVLTVDGQEIPADKRTQPIPHNPGKATVEVKGKKGGIPFSFKSTETFDRGEKVTVNAENSAAGGNYSAVQQCLTSARSAADLNRCIESGGKGRGLTFRGGLEVASYNDTTNVDVVTPTLFFSAENPTAGWALGGSYTVDVVSNASPDIVATASRRFDEVRHAGALAGDVKVGPARIAVDGAVSVEPDYIGRAVGAAVSADFNNKQVTPTLAYHAGFDILARAHTPFDVFHRNITNHSVDASVSIVLNPTSILVLAGTAAFQLGDTSKPYRHIPMFSSAVAPTIPKGATPDLVDSARLAPSPLEQVPDSRQRYAFLTRFAKRFDTSTFRVDERLYMDSWGLKASTTDLRYYIDATKTFRIGPHVRFHAQGAVDFWQRAYVATETSQGWTLPKYRTLDREYSPYISPTAGFQARWAITDILALSLVVEGNYTQYLDTIYVVDRFGLFTATTMELGLE